MILQLVLYADELPSPITLEDAVISVKNLSELVTHLKKVLRRVPLLISYWNFEHNRYEPLTSLQNLQSQRGTDRSVFGVDAAAVVPAQLWVETRPPRLEPVDPEVNVEEYRQLQDHVQQFLGEDRITYSLQSALRVSNPCSERLFDYIRSTQLRADSDGVELLYYTNNSLSLRDVLQRGFDRVTKGGCDTTLQVSLTTLSSGGDPPLPLFVFSTSMTDENGQEIASIGPHSVLLCEVAPGCSWESRDPLSKDLAAPPPPPGCNSVCHHTRRSNGLVVRDVRVALNHQALPRYLLTVIGNECDSPRGASRQARFGASPPICLSQLPASSRRGTRRSRESSVESTLFVHKKLHESGSTSTLDGQTDSAPVLLSTITCEIHSGSLLGLWCVTCSRTICPYCASIGNHKGHEVVDVEKVAGEVREKMQKVCHDLSVQLDSYKCFHSQLQLEESQLKKRCKKAVNTVETAFSDLHMLLDVKKRELIGRIEGYTHSLDKPLDEVSCVLQRYKKIIARLDGSWGVATAQSKSITVSTGHKPSTAAATAYLVRALKLLERGVRFATDRHNDSLMLAVDAAKQSHADEATIFHVDCSTVHRSIEELGSVKGKNEAVPSTPHAITGLMCPGSHNTPIFKSPCKLVHKSPVTLDAIDPTSQPLMLGFSGRLDKIPCDHLAESVLDLTRRQLLLRQLIDLRKGYVWCLHDVNRYFNPEQRRAICSRSFQLLGLEWDLRIQVPDTLAGSNASTAQLATASGEDEPVGIFLFPVGHTKRFDFRVIIFSAMVWAEWTVTDWALPFAGKGWGVYPLLPRRELMQTDCLAWENTLKICVAPTSGVY